MDNSVRDRLNTTRILLVMVVRLGGATHVRVCIYIKSLGGGIPWSFQFHLIWYIIKIMGTMKVVNKVGKGRY